MVEYALAPSDPLPAERCASGPLLASWLEFVTGDGQQALPEGFVPLTGDLAAEAADAVDQVAAVSNPNCVTPPTRAPTIPGSPAAAAAAANNAVPGGGGPGGTGPGGGSRGPSSPSRNDVSGAGADVGSARPATSESREEAADIADEAEVEMPPFLGIKAFSEIVSPLALLLLVALLSTTAFSTSGRPPPVAVTRVTGQIGWRLRRGRGRALRPESA
jgi:hypothetical protein